MERSRKRVPGGAKKEPRECLERLRGLWRGQHVPGRCMGCLGGKKHRRVAHTLKSSEGRWGWDPLVGVEKGLGHPER